ncbi:hypothetical protein FRC12_012578, partial [Ceratobasidium sp. 428]
MHNAWGSISAASAQLLLLSCVIGTSVITPFALAHQDVLTSVQRHKHSISWFDCPDQKTTQCAFLDVPRDYSDPSDNDTVSIFMRKFPAQVSSEKRLGSILTNPG